ncbi:hypothetical protein BELL_0319g00070 [Botrytis elliptica]|uniref:Uncharacterized protein n=1 Tax=Botrytis elliptica TaxID=278938 RepID=A0A4Z1JKW5_9HELO|nr:hypothetical protein EAE99_002331 [Botrytis elliptica]TGO73944.1 hypothetical protein BELL_0319g00070 [Botrytis elliptica]
MANAAISDKYMRHIGQLTAKCNCQDNHIVCHHRSSIATAAVQKTKILEETKDGEVKCIAIEPTIPPPQPETYTGHLAVLRNPTHKEWESRPHRYLSPTLCNISPYYVKRFVEPPVREKLLEGKWPGKHHEFTMGKAQEDEIKIMQDSGVVYKKEKDKYTSRVEAERKRIYDFEKQLEILMTKIQEIRWTREKEEELCDYLEHLVGVKESAEQHREFEEQKKEFLAQGERFKKRIEERVESMMLSFNYACAAEVRSWRLLDSIAQAHELLLRDLGECLEEQDAKKWRDLERERVEWVKRKREGGEVRGGGGGGGC